MMFSDDKNERNSRARGTTAAVLRGDDADVNIGVFLDSHVYTDNCACIHQHDNDHGIIVEPAVHVADFETIYWESIAVSLKSALFPLLLVTCLVTSSSLLEAYQAIFAGSSWCPCNQ